MFDTHPKGSPDAGPDDAAGLDGTREIPAVPDPAADPDAAAARDAAEAVLAEPPKARDVSDELAAPPRRRLPALTLLLAAGVLVAGGFVGGVKVQQGRDDGGSAGPGNQAAGPGAGTGARNQAAASGGTGQFPGGGSQGGGNQNGGTASGVTSGTVKVVDGSFIYVSDSSGNIVKVRTDDTTTISVSQTGAPADLHPGDTVVVRGAQGEDGSVTATTVTEGQAAPGVGATGGGASAAPTTGGG